MNAEAEDRWGWGGGVVEQLRGKTAKTLAHVWDFEMLHQLEFLAGGESCRQASRFKTETWRVETRMGLHLQLFGILIVDF